MAETDDRKVNIDNIQGGIWPRLPKFFESFLFFRIINPAAFKEHLKNVAPLITSGAQCKELLEKIREQKKTNPGEKLPFAGVNISFSYKGLEAIGKKDIRGGLYEKGMYSDLVFEGADDPARLDQEYKPPQDWKEKNDNWRIHGVLIIAAESAVSLNNKIAELETAFSVRDANAASINIEFEKHGQRRPNKHREQEHFGYEDHISQPQIKGLDPEPKDKEPKAVPPGYIFVGHDGDPMDQPSWAKEGSFLVFRQLDQKAPEYQHFLDTKSKTLKGFQGPNGSEKLAAHLMGRWRSGAPVDVTPNEDRPELGKFNDFDYKPTEPHTGCPFAAHTRKMRPRGDLQDDDGEDDASVIIRRGITFGPEVSEEEKKTNRTEKHRGIYFLCYQSDIRDGFNLIMTRWASNHYFPEGKKKTGEDGPGVDPFVSQRRRMDHPEGHISLFDGENQEKTFKLDLGVSPWVDQKGGEYFFTPPISALKGELVH